MTLKTVCLLLIFLLQTTISTHVYSMKKEEINHKVKTMYKIIVSPGYSSASLNKFLTENPGIVNIKAKKKPQSALWFACSYASNEYPDSNEKIKVLINHGALCNEVIDEQYPTPLALLSVKGNPLVLFLVTKNADPNKTYVFNYADNMKEEDKERYSSLDIATFSNHLSIVKFFLNRPCCNINATDGDNTPVYYATYKELFKNNKSEMLNLFLEKKADLNLCGTKGKNAIMGAILHENIPLLKTIDHHIDWSWKSQTGETYLHCVCKLKNKDVFNYVIEKIGNKIDINAKTTAGITPVFSAALEGCFENIKFLYNKGADLTLVDNLGQNILMIAIMYDDIEIIKYLLGLYNQEKKPLFNLEAKDIYGCTILHYAADAEDISTASIILKAVPHLLYNKNFGNETPSDVAKKNTIREIQNLFKKQNEQPKKEIKIKKKKKNKKKKNHNSPTPLNINIEHNQHEETSKQNSDTIKAPITKIEEVHEPKKLVIDERCSRWFDKNFLSQEQEKLQNNPSWSFEQKRRYHQIDENILNVLATYGKLNRFTSSSKNHDLDIQYSLIGIMQFEDVSKNPWNPGSHQLGLYHFTKGTNGTIYHVGFNVLRQNFEKLNTVQFAKKTVSTKEYEAFWVPEDNNNGVRHVLFIN